MTDISFLFEQAQLAQAAYASLSVGIIDSDDIDLLTDKEFSLRQAKEFATHYNVVTQHEDPNGSGFSATVFSDASGNLNLAIRGTDGVTNIPDIETDLSILNHGAGYDQIVAMYNWWVAVSTPAGQTVQQFKIDYQVSTDPSPAGSLYSVPEGQGFHKNYYLESAVGVQATGELVEGLASDQDGKLNISGLVFHLHKVESIPS